MSRDYLVSAAALHDDPGCVVFDCRFSLFDAGAGRREYERGHIPGARFADLERDLSSTPGAGGRHPLPDRGFLEARLRDWGVDRDSRIVCYDQSSGAVAGRLWWLVRWLGHADVRLLDGGLDAWVAAGYPTSTSPVSVSRGNFTAGEPLTRICSADDLIGAGMQIVDARDAARFRGESEPIDPVAGHIPGAVCAPCSENLTGGVFRSPAELRARFEGLGLDPGRATACYCGSGVTATHNIVALLLAGYPEPALYPGSWSEWITDPGRPVAVA